MSGRIHTQELAGFASKEGFAGWVLREVGVKMESGVQGFIGRGPRKEKGGGRLRQQHRGSPEQRVSTRAASPWAEMTAPECHHHLAQQLVGATQRRAGWTVRVSADHTQSSWRQIRAAQLHVCCKGYGV